MPPTELHAATRALGEVHRAAGPPATVYRKLLLRQLLEFPTADGTTTLHPDAVDPLRLLGPWWEQRHTALQRQLADDLESYRAHYPDWDRPAVLLTSRGSFELESPNRSQAQWAIAPFGLLAQIAIAPLAGMVTRPGKAPSPVFAVPADVTGGAWKTSEEARNWVSLGPVPPQPQLELLLEMFGSVFATRRADDTAVQAMFAALQPA